MGLSPLQRQRLQFCIDKAASKTRAAQQNNALPLIAEARALASLMEPGDSRVDELHEIATTCQSIGLNDLSCEILEEALQEIERVSQTAKGDEWISAEDITWHIQLSVFLSAGETFLKLGQRERGLSLIDRSLAIQNSYKEEDDLDAHFSTLGEIAYLYSTAGLIDKAMAIAQEMDEYHAAFDFFLPFSWYCLREDKHKLLIQTLLASDWTGYQGSIAYEIAKFCQELKELSYVQRLISEIAQITTQAYLIIGLARVFFREEGQIEAALSHLERADALILSIQDSGLRQSMRAYIDMSLDEYLQLEDYLKRLSNSKRS